MMKKKFINECLKLAYKAKKQNEVPVGCIIVDENNEIISRAYNKKNKNNDATCHAEIIAIKKACKKKKNWRLNNCTIYISLEPCMMCFGAILESRIKTIVYGAKSNYEHTFDIKKYNNKVELVFIKDKSCEKILGDFFQKKRKKKQNVI